MVRTTLALCVVVLSGCAAHTLADGGGRPGDGGPDPCTVKVFVRAHPNAGKPRILVDNDPVYPRGGVCGGKVTWHMMTPGYSLDRIVFSGTTPNCTAGASDYSCNFTQPPPLKFNYSMTVGGPGGPYTVDPSVIID